jgi:hypothetical protein
MQLRANSSNPGGHLSLLQVPEEVLANILDFVLPIEFCRFSQTDDAANGPQKSEKKKARIPAASLRLTEAAGDSPDLAPSPICLPLRALHSKLNAAVLLSVLRWINSDGQYMFSRFDHGKQNNSKGKVAAVYQMFHAGNSLYERLYLLALRQASPEEQANKGLPPGFGETYEQKPGRNIRSLPQYALEGLRLRRAFPYDFFVRNAALVKVDLSSPLEVERIEDGFFSECSALKSIDLKGLGKVVVIRGRFLAGCTALEEVDLTPLVSLTDLGQSALAGCLYLRLVNVEKLHQLRRIGSRFLASSFVGLQHPQGYIADESNFVVNLLGMETLAGLLSLGEGFLIGRTTVALPYVSNEPAERREGYHHRSAERSPCSELMLRCPLLKTIGANFGAKLSGIRKVDLSACLEQKTIPDYFLTNSSDVEVVVFPPNTTTIGKEVLKSCRLRSLPNFHELTSLTAIGDSFAFAAHLVSIKTPPSLRTVGSQFLERNSKLTTVEMLLPLWEQRDEEDEEPASGGEGERITFGNRCFAECSRLAKLEVLCHKSGTEAQMSSRMKGRVEIGDFFAACCSELVRVDLGLCPIVKVGCGFLDSCVTLVDVRLPSTLTHLGADFFSGCSALERVDLTRCTNIASIPVSFLRNCRSLKCLLLSGEERSALEQNVPGVSSAPQGITYISERFLEGSGLFNHAVELHAGDCDAEPVPLPTRAGAAQPAGQSLPNLVIRVPRVLQVLCSNFLAKAPLLAHVDLSRCDGLQSVADGVFAYCKSLNCILLPPSVRVIGRRFLCGTAATELTWTTLRELTSIGDDFCLSCSKLRRVTLPSSITHIGTDFLTTTQPTLVDLSAVPTAVITASGCATAPHLRSALRLPDDAGGLLPPADDKEEDDTVTGSLWK